MHFGKIIKKIVIILEDKKKILWYNNCSVKINMIKEMV